MDKFMIKITNLATENSQIYKLKIHNINKIIHKMFKIVIIAQITSKIIKTSININITNRRHLNQSKY